MADVTFPATPVWIAQGSSAPTDIGGGTAGLAAGDTCIIAVLSTNDQSCGAPTRSSVDAGFTSIADVDGSGDERVKAWYKTLVAGDFFGGLFLGLDFDDWDAVSGNHILIAWLAHGDGPLSLHDFDTDTATVASGTPWTVATISDPPRAAIAISLFCFQSGATNITFDWDGDGAAVPQWDEAVTGNNQRQGGYKLYDDADAGVSLDYNTAGNNNHAILTFVMLAAGASPQTVLLDTAVEDDTALDLVVTGGQTVVLATAVETDSAPDLIHAGSVYTYDEFEVALEDLDIDAYNAIVLAVTARYAGGGDAGDIRFSLKEGGVELQMSDWQALTDTLTEYTLTITNDPSAFVDLSVYVQVRTLTMLTPQISDVYLDVNFDQVIVLDTAIEDDRAFTLRLPGEGIGGSASRRRRRRRRWD